jgi:hypothetical protein
MLLLNFISQQGVPISYFLLIALGIFSKIKYFMQNMGGSIVLLPPSLHIILFSL